MSAVSRREKLIEFLENDLEIPGDSIDVAVKQSRETKDSLPILLWQYGFISLKQLEQIFGWLEQQ